MTKKKIGGCGLFGKVEENYFYKDDIRRVKFDRPDKLNVLVRLVIARYKDFQDIDTDSIKENLKGLDFNIGESVYASRIISSINLTQGFYIKELTVNDSNVVNVDYREYAEIGAIIKYKDKLYRCLIENSNGTPSTNTTKWDLLIKNASEKDRGIIQLATQQEVDDGLNDLNSITPLKLQKKLEPIINKALPVATLEQQGITQLTNVIDSSEDKAITPKAVNTVKKKADQTPDALENKLLIGKDDKSYRLIDVDELTKLLSYAETTGTGLNIAMSQKAVTEALTDKSTALGPEQSTATVVLHQTFGDNMAAALTTVPRNSVVTSTYSEKWPAAAIRYRPIIRTGGSI